MQRGPGGNWAGSSLRHPAEFRKITELAGMWEGERDSSLFRVLRMFKQSSPELDLKCHLAAALKVPKAPSRRTYPGGSVTLITSARQRAWDL